MLNQASFDPRQTRLCGGYPRHVVNDDMVIVDVRDGSPDVPVDTEGHDPEDECLHVEHHIKANLRVGQAGEQEQAWCLHGPACNDNPLGTLDVTLAACIDPLDTGCLAIPDQDA
jgi:hypothetical protein